MDSRPIGLFDSGIGGLTVFKSLLAALPNESFVYLGDTARLPYGSKSPQTIERYLIQNIDFLIRKNVKAIVVACNSASTVMLGAQREFGLPVYNVIEPGARAAVDISSGKRIGVLGTRATVSAKSYVTAIHACDPSAFVIQQPCPLLVPLVEEGWESDPVTQMIAARYLAPLTEARVDTIIMGCTHYPVLRSVFEACTGGHINFVDSSEAVARLIHDDLGRGRLQMSEKRQLIEIMTTDVSQAFSEVAKRLMSPHEIPELNEVDISPFAP